MYTYFDQTKKVLCVIQTIEDAEDAVEEKRTVMGHDDEEIIDTALNDSTAAFLTVTLKTAPTLASDSVALVEGTATNTIATEPAFEPAVAKKGTVTGLTADEAGTQTVVVPYVVDAAGLAAYNTAHNTDYVAAEVVLPAPTTLTWTATE